MTEHQKISPASFSRLVARVVSSAQPLVRLWHWPGSGASATLQHLASLPDATVLRPEQGLAEAIPTARGKLWLLCNYQPSDQDLLSATHALEPDQRLIFTAHQRSLTNVLPEERVGPQEHLLERDECATFFGSGASSRHISQLFARTEGWFEPLRWLAEGLEESDLRQKFEEEILNVLPSNLLGLVKEMASSDPIELDVWRAFWLSEPEKLAAFERLRLEWGLLVPEKDRPGTWRLPRIMQDWLTPQNVTAKRLQAVRQILDLDAQSTSSDHEEAPSPPKPAGSETSLRLADSDSPDFELQFFGYPLVFLGQPSGKRKPLEWTLRRAFQTLAFLALAPERRASKEQLIEAIWSDVDPDRIRKNFHPTLSVLRRTLGGSKDIVQFRQGYYVLDPDIHWQVDVETFESLLASGEASRLGQPQEALVSWQAAWSLYHGPLFGEEEVLWGRARREQLRRRYLRLLRELGELAKESGEQTLAIDAYRSVLLEEPFEERIHLSIMELYSVQGRRDLVRRQYVRLQELLLDELSVEPMSETQERYHQLMR